MTNRLCHFDFELIAGKYRTSDDLLRMIELQNTRKQLKKVVTLPDRLGCYFEMFTTT